MEEKNDHVSIPLSDDVASIVPLESVASSPSAFNFKTGKCRPLSLEWYNLGVTVTVAEGFLNSKTHSKTILKGISGKASPGELLSIMGPSGGGKTTLLNSLSRRQHITEGKILLNGKSLPRNFNKVSAYVMQDDRLFEVLTPRELFQFSANLRLPRDMPYEKKQEQVEMVISKLKLQNCADTRVGGNLLRGLSGGERKRASIGYELITNPSLLFLDEPTSGLDSSTALSLLQSLKNLALDGHTIICTIHQPSSEIFRTFDRLLLLVRGEVAFSGESKTSIDYFSNLGFPCPNYTNPADFFMDLLQTSTEEELKRSRIFVEAAAKETLQVPPEPGNEENKQGKGGKIDAEKRATFWTQLFELTRRGWRTVIRNPVTFQARFAQTFIMSLLIGLVYLRLDTDQIGIGDREGALYFITISSVMSALNGILLTFPLERALLIREQSNGMYSIASYYFGKFFSTLPLDAFFTSLLSVLLYFIVGLNTSSAAPFFLFLFANFSLSMTASSMGLLLGSMLPNAEAAVAIAPMAIIPFMLFGGFFANLKAIPVWLSWIQYISVFKWGFQALVITEFHDLEFHCVGNQFIEVETPQGTVSVCPVTSGNQVLAQMEFEYPRDYWVAIAVLAGIFAFCRILALAFLSYQTRKALKKTQT